MADRSLIRRLLKRLEPEGIPWPGSVLYNALSSTSAFQHHYSLVAKDIAAYCPSGSLLDIGTGPGRLLIRLHPEAPSLSLAGVDISAAMVAKARGNIAAADLAGAIAIYEANAVSLPFAAASFDIVVSTGSVHHWQQPTAALDEIYRVLKPEGYCLLYDLVSDTPRAALAEMTRTHGKMKTTIFWLHSFEEPFYNRRQFELLAEPSMFREGTTRFVGLLCCLVLKK